MEKIESNIVDKVCEIVSNFQKDGRAHAGRIGSELLKVGIDYKKYGCSKLNQFFSNQAFYNKLKITKCVEENDKPPVLYVQLESDVQEQYKDRYKQTIELYDWAYLPPMQIKNLASKTLKERWYLREEENDKFPILKNYLQQTFMRLEYEDKVKYARDKDSKNEYAAFNTGLVDKKYEWIYAVFEINKILGKQRWHLKSFVVAGEREGKILTKLFDPLPERANYFKNIEDLFYDTSKKPPEMQIEHFIVDRLGRFPKQFIKNCCMIDPNILNMKDLSIDNIENEDRQTQKNYFKEIGDRIGKNPQIYRIFSTRLKEAEDLAIKRIKWNYKTAVPIYYPPKKNISLLLPLSLINNESVDVALVVEKQQSGAYQGETILTLEMAYMDSRLITRPDSDWLNANHIGKE